MGISYLPVVLNGEIIGYLYAVDGAGKAHFLQKLESPQDSLLAAVQWSERFAEAEAKGFTPVEAISQWIGAAEDAVAGVVPAGSEIKVADTREQFGRIANPDYVNPADPRVGVEFSGTFENLPREDSLSPLTLEKVGYSFLAESPIRYVPVVLRGEVVGYLWAANADNAADYIPREATGPVGLDAGLVWGPRLLEAFEAGLPPLEAIRGWRGKAEDSTGGHIPSDAGEKELNSVADLEELARLSNGDS